VSKENLMQLIRTIFKSLKWNLVPAVMLGGLLLGGCDSAERAQPPRPGAGGGGDNAPGTTCCTDH